MATKAQQRAKILNWCIFRLQGCIATVRQAQYDAYQQHVHLLNKEQVISKLEDWVAYIKRAQKGEWE